MKHCSIEPWTEKDAVCITLLAEQPTKTNLNKIKKHLSKSASEFAEYLVDTHKKQNKYLRRCADLLLYLK